MFSVFQWITCSVNKSETLNFRVSVKGWAPFSLHGTASVSPFLHSLASKVSSVIFFLYFHTYILTFTLFTKFIHCSLSMRFTFAALSSSTWQYEFSRLHSNMSSTACFSLFNTPPKLVQSLSRRLLSWAICKCKPHPYANATSETFHSLHRSYFFLHPPSAFLNVFLLRPTPDIVVSKASECEGPCLTRVRNVVMFQT